MDHGQERIMKALKAFKGSFKDGIAMAAEEFGLEEVKSAVLNARHGADAIFRDLKQDRSDAFLDRSKSEDERNDAVNEISKQMSRNRAFISVLSRYQQELKAYSKEPAPSQARWIRYDDAVKMLYEGAIKLVSTGEYTPHGAMRESVDLLEMAMDEAKSINLSDKEQS